MFFDAAFSVETFSFKQKESKKQKYRKTEIFCTGNRKNYGVGK